MFIILGYNGHHHISRQLLLALMLSTPLAVLPACQNIVKSDENLQPTRWSRHSESQTSCFLGWLSPSGRVINLNYHHHPCHCYHHHCHHHSPCLHCLSSGMETDADNFTCSHPALKSPKHGLWMTKQVGTKLSIWHFNQQFQETHWLTEHSSLDMANNVHFDNTINNVR